MWRGTISPVFSDWNTLDQLSYTQYKKFIRFQGLPLPEAANATTICADILDLILEGKDGETKND